MINIINTLLEFKNITEIKFTKVKDNKFSLSIMSDIIGGNQELKDCVFESQLCTIDSMLQLNVEEDDSYRDCWSKFIQPLRNKTCTIPLNITLLSNNEYKYEICTIKPQKNEI